MLIKKIPVLCLFLSLALWAAAGQNNPAPDGRYYESLARQAYQARDFAAFLANMKRAAELRPNHPRLMFNLAAAYALNGNQQEALGWLDRMTAMGLVFAPEKEKDFDSIRTSPHFELILKNIARNRQPVINGAPAFTLHEKGFIPEGLAYDPRTRAFFIGSVYKRKIVLVNPKGEAKDFATVADGLWSVMGMRVDAARRLLWVASAAHPQMSNYHAEENGTSGVFKFDLRTGKLLRKYILPNKPKGHWLGDLILAPNGDVFASDSLAPEIYMIDHRRDQIELFLGGPPFVNLQGMDFTPDRRHLFVADYSRGLFVIDLQTRQRTEVVPAYDVTLLGIDGLYSYRGQLLAVQNGINPPRLVRLFLNKDLTRAERLETVEANDPNFDEPTLGTLVGNTFYLIANSQWAAIDEKGNLAPDGKLKEPVVLRIRL